ncbi:MAG: hypothetical protein HC897_11180 [Thermoanaerobaculia bacterium]|nr:hypothetical protein [Thermoanaerobaculia bacterium]
MALVLTAVVAVPVGLKLFYIDNPVFGSLKDYLALMTWGLAAEWLQGYFQKLGAGSQPAPAQPVPSPVPAALHAVAA